MVNIVEIIEDCWRISKMAEWSVWMMTQAREDSIKCLTFLTTQTKPTISSFVGQ